MDSGTNEDLCPLHILRRIMSRGWVFQMLAFIQRLDSASAADKDWTQGLILDEARLQLPSESCVALLDAYLAHRHWLQGTVDALPDTFETRVLGPCRGIDLRGANRSGALLRFYLLLLIWPTVLKQHLQQTESSATHSEWLSWKRVSWWGKDDQHLDGLSRSVMNQLGLCLAWLASWPAVSFEDGHELHTNDFTIQEDIVNSAEPVSFDGARHLVEQAWSRVLQADYVHGLLASSRDRFLDASQRLRAYASTSHDGRVSEIDGQPSTSRHATIPKPFLLTVPRPRCIQEAIPKPVPCKFQARPVPISNEPGYGLDQWMRKSFNQERSSKSVTAGSVTVPRPPKLHTAQRSLTRSTTSNSLPDNNWFKSLPASFNEPSITSKSSTIPPRLAEDAEQRLERFHQSFQRQTDLPVATNWTTLLREEARLQKQMDAEQLRLNDHVRLALAGSLMVSDGHLERHLMERHRQDERAAQVRRAKHRLMAQISRFEAQLAKQQHIEKTRQEADHQRAHLRHLHAQLKAKHEESCELALQHVHAMKSLRQRLPQLKHHLSTIRHESVAKQRAEMDDWFQQQDQQRQQEWLSRRQRVQEHRDNVFIAQRERANRVANLFDADQPADPALSTAMSMSALKEALNQVKQNELRVKEQQWQHRHEDRTAHQQRVKELKQRFLRSNSLVMFVSAKSKITETKPNSESVEDDVELIHLRDRLNDTVRRCYPTF